MATGISHTSDALQKYPIFGAGNCNPVTDSIDRVSIAVYGFQFTKGGQVTELVMPSRISSCTSIRPYLIMHLHRNSWQVHESNNPFDPNTIHFQWRTDLDVTKMTGFDVCRNRSVKFQDTVFAVLGKAEMLNNGIPIFQVIDECNLADNPATAPTHILVKTVWSTRDATQPARAAELKANRSGFNYERGIAEWSNALLYRRTSSHQTNVGADLWILPIVESAANATRIYSFLSSNVNPNGEEAS